jgi:hypothetical protein
MKEIAVIAHITAIARIPLPANIFADDGGCFREFVQNIA